MMMVTRRAATFAMMAMSASTLAVPPAWAEDEQQLYAAAKKEGQVTWYSGFLDQPICDAIGQAFTQKYPGIRVNAIKTTSQVAFQRLTAGHQGRRRSSPTCSARPTSATCPT